MRVKVEKWIIDDYIPSYKVREIYKCCDDIIESKCVDLIYAYDNADDSDYSFKLIDRNYDDDIGDYYEYEDIKFCPFCGAYIKIDIEEVVDKTEEFNNLLELKQELSTKIRNTDSKKLSYKLENELRSVRDKINSYHYNDDKLK